MGSTPPLVAMTGIGKRYGGVQACRDVDFAVRSGEVHALLGENGAGKSTLMRVLSGDITDYEGSIEIDGAPVRFRGPADAQRAGIAMIPQELDLVPALSVADNIFLGREPRSRWGGVDRRRMERETGRLLRQVGIRLDPRQPVEELRTGEQQLVTIGKALSLDARVLIMDEPTSALSAAEVQRLFQVIAELRAAGAGVVYISHRMEEIGAVADRATVLRNGRVVAEFAARSMTASQAAEAMVGRPLSAMFRTTSGEPGEEVLRVRELAVRPRRPRPGRREPAGITLSVRRGEIVGVAGLLGSGRTELLETLYGAGTPGQWTGEVLLRGRPVRPRGPRHAVRLGLAFVPEDRRISGLVLEHSVLANTALSIVDRIARFGLLRRRTETDAAADAVRRLRVKLAGLGQPVGTLSGGNQQKVVFGRMLLLRPDLLLLDDPTRGVDVGAKAEIYRLLGEVAREGVGILLASSELDELVGVCDRVIVLRDGRSVREFGTGEARAAELLAAVMGDGGEAGAAPPGERPASRVGGGT
ncbi:sugar ABC transporter ATP-binding protein [Gandjariella thermophila]|uniref:D-ribose transporter ATP-binding protein n=1 Tax=Gandjariella thermophila TaxID=1931992 RepID=A0A4D4IZ93_9PSEU|nr:sugar ABC transporter ATP-binding protein [Gandjariella thermophila]GDY29665.1 D-ribose transporter ATP-binding protein [Gandjariella thermophila]